MVINDAVFVKSCVCAPDFPKNGWPEMAFVGRSNVGKSSVMNLLLGRKHLVKTSSTPGKTQTINFFAVNQACYFVDLPGYGYARVPHSVQAGWKGMIESYLIDRPTLCGVVLVLDPRHPPTPLDEQMWVWLRSLSRAVIPIATKSDQVPQGKRCDARHRIAAALDLPSPETVIFVSAKTGEGKHAVWHAVDRLFANTHPR